MTPKIQTRTSFEFDLFNPRVMLRSFLRLIRQPIIRFLAQGDLIIVGNVLARSDQPPLVQLLGERDCVILGDISIDETNPGCVVPPGCKAPKSIVRAIKSGNFSDPESWEIAP